MGNVGSRGIDSALETARRLVGVGAPDRQRSLSPDAPPAETYHQRTATGNYHRRQAVTRLAPSSGEVILDVGCGTGLNFAAIEDAIGPSGRLIGVEVKPTHADSD